MENRSSNKVHLPSIWRYVTSEYKIMELLGEGSFGQVVKAQHIKTGNIFAIKLVRNIFDSLYECKKVLREIQILR